MKKILLPFVFVTVTCTALFSCANNEEMNNTPTDSTTTETTMPAATPEVQDTVVAPTPVDPGMDTTNSGTSTPANTPAK